MSNSGLYRSTQSRMIAGVMGGIAERFGWNVNLLRVIFVLIAVMSVAFPGILVYLILWLVMPLQPKNQIEQNSSYTNPIRTVNEKHHSS